MIKVISPVFQLIDKSRPNMRWSCANHMCRSPIFQYSYDEKVVCNGCMVAVPLIVAMNCEKKYMNEAVTMNDPVRDKARELQDVQRGPYPEVYDAITIPDNSPYWKETA